jgi:hypothetical protein
MRCDQDDRDADRGGKDADREPGGGAVGAVYERDREHRQRREREHAGPFDPVDARFADDDALAARVESVLERAGDLALRDLLTLAARLEAESEPERVGERGRRRGQRDLAMRHRGPFIGHGAVDVARDQGAHAITVGALEVVNEQLRHAQRACLAVDL